MVGFGILGSAPAAIAGASDWSDTHGAKNRVGLVHALLNGGASLLQIASWLSRVRGHRSAGVRLSLVALGLTAASAYLGGHLSMVRGVGVNHTAFESPDSSWIDVADEDDLTEGVPLRVLAGDAPVMLVRQGGAIRALSATCTHAGGPLDEGTLVDGCVRCPWHGSEFLLDDGTVQRGPASVPEPSWEVQVSSGRIALRLQAA